MQVFRAVNPSGEGIYVSGFNEVLLMNGGATQQHPMSWQDSMHQDSLKSKPWLESELRLHGFISYAQMFRWFYYRDWIVALYEHGGEIRVYPVDPEECIIGRSQCTFLFPKNEGEYRSLTLDEVLIRFDAED